MGRRLLASRSYANPVSIAISLLVLMLTLIPASPSYALSDLESPILSPFTSGDNSDYFEWYSSPQQSGEPSRYGPYNSSPDAGAPRHAYSPFEKQDEVLDQYQVVPGQVMIKFREQASNSWASAYSLESAVTSGLLPGTNITALEPVFPASYSRALSMSADASGSPTTLQRWYRGTLTDGTNVTGIVQSLARDASVEAVEPVFLRTLDTVNITDPQYGQQWHLNSIHAQEAWQFLSDNGTEPGGRREIIVAVIDTGVDYTHLDLVNNIWTNGGEIAGNGVDDDSNGFVDDAHGANVVGDTRNGDPMDDHGHGTHVAGIIAAQANNDVGGVGIAFNIQIMPIKAAQYSGVLTTTDIAEAIYYATEMGADVINMSFGGYARSQLEEDALAVAFGQAVLVAAAGNDGLPNEIPYPGYVGRIAPMYPAALNWVLGVMAQSPSPDENGDYLAGFSNYDGIPRSNIEYEVMAPGVDILSTLPNDKYAAWDGTSMAAPVVSGIAALVRSYFHDKDVYSSRFIMGQVASTGPVLQGKTMLNGSVKYYHTADTYAALTEFPQPELSYLEHWLFDTTNVSATNDDDGIIDAGETIDLAIVIRNQWGKADNVTVSLRAWNGVSETDDPYVTMITSNVSYGAIGSFNWDDNGLIYDAEGAITGVGNPFKFIVSANASNDHVIPFLVTITGQNGFNPANSTVYSFESRFELVVQKGREVPRIISGADVFGQTHDYPAENLANSVASADFNGDNFSDLVVANRTDTGSVNVLLNDGNGGFANKTNYPMSYASRVVTADFNGDLIPDIAVSILYSVAVMLNTGNGTFTVRPDFDYGDYRIDLIAADFNGDNLTDLATANSHPLRSVSVLLNTGNATFAPGVTYSTGDNPYALTSADFNGDNFTDIAVVNYNSGSLSVLFNTGNGTFSQKTDYFLDGYPRSVTAGDFNGDNFTDLATVWGANRVEILLNNGEGTFGQRTEYPFGENPQAVIAIDFNDDSLVDLATADSSNYITVRLNADNANFLPKGKYPVGATPCSVISADFNGDGLPDVATANQYGDSVSVLLNTGEVTLEPDFTLTKDYYWLVPDQTLIEDNAIVAVEPGTQVQFWAGDPNDPYSQHPNAYIQVEGSLVVQGTSEEPIEFFPGAMYSNKFVKITSIGAGVVILQYTRVTNPFIGQRQEYWAGGGATLVDHSYFNQEGDILWAWEADSKVWTALPPVVRSQLISNSIFHKIGPNPSWGTGSDPYWFFAIYDNTQGNLYDSSHIFLRGMTGATGKGNVFLKNYRNAYNSSGEKIYNTSRAEEVGYKAPAGDDETGRTHNQFRDNAILNRWWDPAIDHWMQFYSWQQGSTEYTRDYTYYLNNNYWGTNSTALIDAAIQDFYANFNKARIEYQPILTSAPETAYPFVSGVVISQGSENTSRVGPGSVNFTVTFNRDMDTTVQPKVSFGPDLPVTDYTIHPIEGGWQDARTWVGTFNINPITGDGYQLIRIADARAADDHWLVTGDDSERFRFEIITSGTEAMNLQATGGEGYVDLMWAQDDFPMLAGYNLYRSTTADGTYIRVNSSIIPTQEQTLRDADVQPGQPYYYKFTVIKTDMTESNFSNVATATPLDTIPPVIDHTPVSSAPFGYGLQIHADVTDNVRVVSVTLHYRATGATTYQVREMAKTTGNRYSATLDGSLVVSPGLEYYIEATDGVTTVSSGRADNPYQVAVGDSPQVTAVSPDRGASSGNTTVIITGSNFKPGANVLFGGIVAGNITLVNGNQLTAITPAHFPATVDITIINTDNQSGTLLKGYTYISETALLSLPDTTGDPHSIVQIPVIAANVQGMVAVSLTVNFDSQLLSVQDVHTGSLTSGWSLASNNNTSGEARISIASPGGSVTGSGTLAYLDMEVIGGTGNSSVLSFSDVLLNDGAIPVETSNGSMQIIEGYGISGAVTFWADGSAVPNTELILSGSRSYSALSQANGAYNINGILSGDYNLTPEKSDDLYGISAYDASLVLQHDVGMNTLAGNAANAADVNKSGSINSMDAYYILEKAVDLITLPFPGAGIVWEFVPSNRSYSSLSSNQTNQDFTAVLLGDVSGGWSQGMPQNIPMSASSAELIVDNVTSLSSFVTQVPLKLNLQGSSLYGADIVLKYDETVMSAISVNSTSLSTNFTILSNLSQPGEIRIAMAAAQPIVSSGILLSISFNITGDVGAAVINQIMNASLNENAIPVQSWDGSLLIVREGDANSDGNINALDITRVERIIAGLDSPAAGANANRDDSINALDITKTERIIVGFD